MNVNIIENKMDVPVEDVISIVLRDGNKKRPYLIMNKLQGKYIPIKGEDALKMFIRLGDEALFDNKSENVLVIGFAETATAIGAGVALSIGKRYPDKHVVFMPTTRELYWDKNKVEFKEEHSHAVEQYLYCSIEQLKSFDTIVFAEDEITTGNTIMNFVKQLSGFGCHPKRLIALSLLNCMNLDETEIFNKNNIDIGYLIKTDRAGLSELKTVYENFTNNTYIDSDVTSYTCLYNSSIPNPRMGVEILEYERACESFANKIFENIDKYEKVLVIGTEECIYPAMKLSEKLDAVMQTSTRVPVCVKTVIDESPIENKYEVGSLYGDRITYLYNLPKDCDRVIVVTDGKNNFPVNFCKVLLSRGMSNITVSYI